MVLEESWEGGGAARSIYLRTTDGAPAVRLGEGVPLALSPDKQWVLSTPVAADQLVLLPTGVGQPQPLPNGPDRLLLPGRALAARWPAIPGLRRPSRSARAASTCSRSTAAIREPVTPEGVFGRIAVLPDGEHFVTRGIDRRLAVFSIAGGEPRALAGAEPRDRPDRRQRRRPMALRAERLASCPREIARVHLRTGAREPVRSLLPPDPAGTMEILRIVMTPDARAYAYTFVRALSSLYLVDGLK